MTSVEIFSELEANAVLRCRIGFNRFIFVPWEIFKAYIPYFEEDRYQKGKYRLGGLFRNIHVAPTPDGYANIHWDHGNPNRNAVIGAVAHGVLDCIAYPVVCTWRMGRFIFNPTLAEMRQISGQR